MTRRELVWLSDLTGTQVDAIGHGFLDLWTDTRLDQSETMGFEIAADHLKIGRLIPDAEILHRSRRFYVVEVEQLRRDAATTVAIEAHALWYRLGDQLYVGSFLATDLTPRQGLTAILAGSGWTVGGQTSASSSTFSMEQQDRTRLGLLRSWAKITGRSLVFDTFSQRVDLVDTRGVARGLAFRYGRNVQGMRRRLRPPETTRLFAYGADDLTIAGVNAGVPYVEDLSYYTDRGLTEEQAAARFTRSKVLSDPAFVREADLFAAAELRLAELAGEQVSYEIDVVDLAEFSEVAEAANVGDTVGVYDPDFAEDLRPIVTRYRRHWLQPWRNKIELATIPPVISDGSSSARPSQSAQWDQYIGPVAADQEVRNDGDYIVGRISLRFREGGRAHFGVKIDAVGVGAGDMIVTVVDTAADPETELARVVVPYTDGAEISAPITFALEELSGSYSFSVRVTTEATGGPDPADGVDITADPDDPVVVSSFWIMAQGAVQETPTIPSSIVFDFTGDVQEWTVPDGVEEATFEVKASAGTGGGGIPGSGGIVTFSRPVIPGTDYNVYVGGRSGAGLAAGWPNGGDAVIANGIGGSGGGASYIIEAALDDDPVGVVTNAIAVAGAGGGGGDILGNDVAGGDGGFLAGTDGAGMVGSGATQSAPGLGKTGSRPGENGDVDGQGFGGDGYNAGGPDVIAEGGGGGGGWHGGGGGGGGSDISGGGGGSGFVDDLCFDVFAQDGANTGDGQITISWATPIEQ